MKTHTHTHARTHTHTHTHAHTHTPDVDCIWVAMHRSEMHCMHTPDSGEKKKRFWCVHAPFCDVLHRQHFCDGVAKLLGHASVRPLR